MLVDNFTIFAGIFSGHVAFFGLKPLIILLICLTIAALMLKLLFSFGMSTLISLILG